MVYGFSKERAGRLRQIADQKGRHSRKDAEIKYPAASSFLPGIPFSNTAAETIPAYGVMRITGSIAKTSTAPFRLQVGKPDSNYHGLYLVNGPDIVAAAADNGTGTGFFYTGDYPEQYALYNSAATPAGGESWGVISGSWLLHQHGPGFYILGGWDGTKVSVIQSIPAEILVKRTAGDLAAGSSGEFEVWGGTAGSESDSGLRITALNKMSVTFKDEKFGAVGFLNGQAYAVRFQE